VRKEEVSSQSRWKLAHLMVALGLLSGVCVVLVSWLVLVESSPHVVRALQQHADSVTWERQDYGIGIDTTVYVRAEGVSQEGFAAVCSELSLQAADSKWRAAQDSSISSLGWPPGSFPWWSPPAMSHEVTKAKGEGNDVLFAQLEGNRVWAALIIK